MQDHEMDAYLGDLADYMAPWHRERLLRESDAIDVRYPNPDADDARREAFNAAIMYLVGDKDVLLAGIELRNARAAYAGAMARAQQIAAMTVADERMSEVAAAVAAGIDRMTLRKALGK